MFNQNKIHFTFDRCKRFAAILFFTCFLSTVSLFAQDQYFQQEVNYKIKVSLNDVKHELSAFEEINYINNSSSEITFIWFHIWPNAYKNHKTALAKQILESGDTKFYFSKESERGFMDSLDFKVNGSSVKVEYDEDNIDICKLILNEPLKAGANLTITTPFHVKIPDAKFSRLGHDQQAYYISQWYPKPAVFDNAGWHPMPYLNQGEFYSEYGSFDVSITLPKNYLLAATGDRIDAKEEEQWLETKIEETENLIKQNKLKSGKSPFPASASEYKTIRFKQTRVHDFAWFADKRFHVLKDNITLINSDKKVDTWVFFTNNEAELWKDALEYVNDATLFYSYSSGNYPYNHVTAIDGTIAAGGGMEYPNITVIGQSGNKFTLETTIAHEVGHNWFYGILGSNERDYPGMDEGMNSFYEMRYVQQKYPEKTLADFMGKDSTFNTFGLNKFKHKAYYQFAYLLAARKNTDQAINTKAPLFTDYNYGAIVYAKTAIVFDYFMNSIGEEKMDEAMHFYFDNWKFKHPSPKNLQNTMEYYGSKDINWFVDDMIGSTKKLDYKITGQKKQSDGSYKVTVKNVGEVVGPVTLGALRKGQVIGEVWYQGFEGKKVFEFPPAKIDRFTVDANSIMPDVHRQNNSMRTRGLFKKIEPLQFNLLAKMDNANKTQINYLPILGANYYNGFMLGCAFYNYSLLQKRFEYTIAPMYAFQSHTPVGFADAQFNLLPKKVFQQITVGARFKSFAYNSVDPNNFYPAVDNKPSLYAFNYYKIEPFIRFDIKKKIARSSIDQYISIRSVNLITETDDTYNSNIWTFAPLTHPIKKTITSYINELSYNLNNSRTINPFNVNLKLQQNQDFGKISLTINYKITLKKDYYFDLRLFAGTFVYGNNRGAYRYRASGFNGYQDYLYDYNYLARNEYNGLGFNQFSEQDGAMKVWTPLGQSDTWLGGFNIKSPKFFKLPIKLFADVVICDGQFLNKEKTLYDAGFEICLWKDIFEVYFPLVYNNDIKNTFTLNGKSTFGETVRFTLNLNKIKPRDLINSNTR